MTVLISSRTHATLRRRSFFNCLLGSADTSYSSALSNSGLPIPIMFMSGTQPTALDITINPSQYIASAPSCLAVVDYYVKGRPSGPMSYTWSNCMNFTLPNYPIPGVMLGNNITGITADKTGTCTWVLLCRNAAMFNNTQYGNLEFIVLPVGAGSCSLQMPNPNLVEGSLFDSGTIHFYP